MGKLIHNWTFLVLLLAQSVHPALQSSGQRVVFQSFRQFHTLEDNESQTNATEQTGSAAICIFILLFHCSGKLAHQSLITDGSKHVCVSSILFKSVSGCLIDK